MNYVELFRAGNNAGEGYNPDANDTDDINELAHLGELIERASASDEVAVYRRSDGRLTLVGDVHGPWAVDV